MFKLKLRKTHKRSMAIGMLALALVWAISILVSVGLGAVYIPPGTAAAILVDALPFVDLDSRWTPVQRNILIAIRLPRVLVAVLIGGALGAGGVMMQGFFRNPLADPAIVGTSMGGTLGAVAAVSVGLRYPIGLATVGALLATWLTYYGAKRHGRVPVATLLLSGILINAILGALVGLSLYIGGVSQTASIAAVFWLMGGLIATSTWTQVKIVILPIVIGISVSYLFRRDLDVLLLGEEDAVHLGVHVERTRLWLIVITAVLVGAATSVSGLVVFVGLAVPYLVRAVFGSHHHILIPAGAMAGGLLFVWADVIARTAIAPAELPVGLVTALAGAPAILYILRREGEMG
ncbi:MAG: FecCD family ABC transporter permease [Candidatus Bipolaricaulia bacterium]